MWFSIRSVSIANFRTSDVLASREPTIDCQSHMNVCAILQHVYQHPLCNLIKSPQIRAPFSQDLSCANSLNGKTHSPSWRARGACLPAIAPLVQLEPDAHSADADHRVKRYIPWPDNSARSRCLTDDWAVH